MSLQDRVHDGLSCKDVEVTVAVEDISSVKIAAEAVSGGNYRRKLYSQKLLPFITCNK